MPEINQEAYNRMRSEWKRGMYMAHYGASPETIAKVIYGHYDYIGGEREFNKEFLNYPGKIIQMEEPQLIRRRGATEDIIRGVGRIVEGFSELLDGQMMYDSAQIEKLAKENKELKSSNEQLARVRDNYYTAAAENVMLRNELSSCYDTIADLTHPEQENV